jgi:hypothetical protein
MFINFIYEYFSIIKIQGGSNDHTQNTLMIDRYKYLDLMPCNYNELKALGIKDAQLEKMRPNQTQLQAQSVPNTLLSSLNMNAGNITNFLIHLNYSD